MPSLPSYGGQRPPAVLWNVVLRTRHRDWKSRTGGKHKTYPAPKKGLRVLGFSWSQSQLLRISERENEQRKRVSRLSSARRSLRGSRRQGSSAPGLSSSRWARQHSSPPTRASETRSPSP